MLYKLDAAAIKSAIIPRNYYHNELANVRFTKPDWNEGGLCPFHADKNPGSFFVNLTTGAYKCFSCGATGGDIIAFAMAAHNLDFAEALAKIANDWGLI